MDGRESAVSTAENDLTRALNPRSFTLLLPLSTRVDNAEVAFAASSEGYTVAKVLPAIIFLYFISLRAMDLSTADCFVRRSALHCILYV